MKIKTLSQTQRVAFYAQTHTRGRIIIGQRVCKRPEGTREWRTIMHMLRTDADVRYVGYELID